MINTQKKNGSKHYDLGIRNGLVYLDGVFAPVNIYIKDEKISSVTSDTLPCKEEVDAKGCKVLPGLIDPHVHFKLGVGARVSSDDFYTGSVKAALGGITTYIDFLDPVKKATEVENAFKNVLPAKGKHNRLRLSYNHSKSKRFSNEYDSSIKRCRHNIHETIYHLFRYRSKNER